jgi:YebC/PmpR family DNA-binding regulatory protein
MSGHSHAKTVMATKMANAAKKGKMFSKMAKIISIAAKDGGDPTKNSKLKAAIEQSKAVSMPKENIDRAIKKGTGELAGEALEEVSYEAFGPGGIALIIEGITDNANRTLGEVRATINQNNGKMAGEGAVRWMFERKGGIVASAEGKTKDELEAMAIEAGADDISWEEDTLVVYTQPTDLETVRKALEDQGLKIDSAKLEWKAKEDVVITDKEKEAAQKLFEALDENDSVNDVYSNLKQ